MILVFFPFSAAPPKAKRNDSKQKQNDRHKKKQSWPGFAWHSSVAAAAAEAKRRRTREREREREREAAKWAEN